MHQFFFKTADEVHQNMFEMRLSEADIGIFVSQYCSLTNSACRYTRNNSLEN